MGSENDLQISFPLTLSEQFYGRYKYYWKVQSTILLNLNHGCVARFDVIVKRNLLEVNDTTLVENIFTLFLLSTGKLGHIRVVAGGHVLMPALLDILLLK